MKRRHAPRRLRQPRPGAGLLATLLLALIVTGCGGGSDQAPDSQLLPDASQLDGAACPDCRSGRLSGVAFAGVALADAQVRIVDAQQHSASGSTDANGRYDIDVSGLSGPLLVQVTGLDGGRPVRLHSACRAAEVGTRAVNVTPLTELIVAQALAGYPDALLRTGKIDYFRIDASNLRQAEMAVEAMVRPLLDAAGVPTPVDLRVTPFSADRQGLSRALLGLTLAQTADGYQLRHAAMSGNASALLAPGRLDGATPLPLDATASQRLTAAIDALTGIEAQLAIWNALFASGVPEAGQLRPLLVASGFLDGGLDADAYVAQVLQRRDAADVGGFSLAGARWDTPRLVEAADDGAVRVRTRLVLPAPYLAREDEAWWTPTAGGWRLRGDGQAARVAVRNLAVLGPNPLSEAELRALTGATCPSAFEALTETTIEQRCRIEGGADGLPTAGVLDLGAPGDPLFGTLALFRSADADALVRLRLQQQHARLLGTPSSRITRHIAFELDSRRVDPRAVQARVFGPGLPAAGLVLLPPDRVAGAPQAELWRVADAAGDDWQSVEIGWCEAAADDAEATACRAAWDQLGAGAVYRFVLRDLSGTALGEVSASLADTPEDASLLAAEIAQRFARFSLQPSAALQPTLGQVLGDTAAAGSALTARLPWTAPADARLRVVEAGLDWWRTDLEASAHEELVRRRRVPAVADGGELNEQASARSGYLSSWLVARLVTQDPMGNRYLHFVAPNNPH